MGTSVDVGVVSTHIPPAQGYGGVSVTAGVLTKAWADSGHKIALVASSESINRRLKPEDVQLGEGVEVSLYRSYGFRRWGFGLGAIPKLFRLCLRSPVVYIHGIATWPSTLAAVFCVLLGRRFMVAVHGGLMPEHVALIRRQKPHKWLFYKWLTFPTLRRAIAVHCTSDTEAEGVRNVLGENVRILLVPNGIDSRAVTVADFPKWDGLQICFLGHIQQEKGINAFIRAWLRTRRERDRLVVAGRSVDGAYFREFQALVEQAGGAISYRGYLGRDEVAALLAESHYLVLPSGLEEAGGMRENFGNVVAEAMAAGRPVLVARGLAWDHVEAIASGFVFDRSEESVCDVLHRVQSLDRTDWQRMSGNARRYVETHLDPVKLGDQVWTMLTGSDTVAASQEIAVCRSD
ncbi:glycosyltransferase family 4 protein [Methylocaldum szegediense]|uniref:Glycosyltransferase involved in cell wall biosynthesis n=1 Tax=Methylocaldum szegediense TaxID=73780 RepID=A0ABN8X6N1_9GAMM|nr:glycosyltransferase family 4 protein [Methylocaldum szegediense]CAI8855263.1 Glycosyltransferase involved in cell wall biosynthesis [Methylocaldum szegediense]